MASSFLRSVDVSDDCPEAVVVEAAAAAAMDAAAAVGIIFTRFWPTIVHARFSAVYRGVFTECLIQRVWREDSRWEDSLQNGRRWKIDPTNRWEMGE